MSCFSCEYHVVEFNERCGSEVDKRVCFLQDSHTNRFWLLRYFPNAYSANASARMYADAPQPENNQERCENGLRIRPRKGSAIFWSRACLVDGMFFKRSSVHLARMLLADEAMMLLARMLLE